MENQEERSLTVRKGAWTKEEDGRLKHCMHKYGEGTWSKVPSRAGLNRCRKSCRMRWLNYLKPDIDNGEFREDEVDLLIRLHKLLGNRWSLIAGRLPGRTANAVKNYWNTHLRKKVFIPDNEKRMRPNYINHPKNQIIKSNYINIIKPRPRTFSKHLLFRMNKPTFHQPSNNIIQPQNNDASKSTYSLVDHEETRFWETLLLNTGSWFDGDRRLVNFSIGQDLDQAVLPELNVGEDVLIHEDHHKCCRYSTIDMNDFWRLLDADHN